MTALDRNLALEASPAPNKLPKGHEPPRLAATVEFGEWSDTELMGGVRLIPIADLVIPKMRRLRRVRVLRAPEETGSAFALDYLDPQVLRRLGARYSIDVLRAKAAAIIRRLPKEVVAKFEWTSAPADIATYLDLDEELRVKIEQIIPGLDLPPAARAYFCSQLVVEVLELSGLRHARPMDAKMTPTGLATTLSREGWRDVSTLYRDGLSGGRYFGLSQGGVQAEYAKALHKATFGQVALQTQAWLEIMQGSLESVQATARRMLDPPP